MSEAKPICVIRISEQARGNNDSSTSYSDFQKIFEPRLPDYHVFCIPMIYDPSEPQEYFTFEVFYEKDFTKTDYEGLKELITKSLN